MELDAVKFPGLVGNGRVGAGVGGGCKGKALRREGSPTVDKSIFTWGVPILGICYGCQLMAHLLGGEVVPAQETP